MFLDTLIPSSPVTAVAVIIVPILVVVLGGLFRMIAKRADKLDKRFDEITTSVGVIRTDLSKTQSIVSFIRGQLVGTTAQRRSRRIEEENGNGREDE